ncbi:porin [Massilia sp. CFBP9012]|uniref:porin n=1 Tax=Massilia sp. CFBP9012 TaxID=3096531 RepID=UPI002A69DB86|nr:porin [Massilia sp. CFBP9012]MDY0976176.1 porin [Massilia sp. CFBP9012]
MRMSIVTLAVLGWSAACASAQDNPALSQGAGAGAIQEAVCAADCLAELQLAARADAVPAASSIFTLESAADIDSVRERARQGTVTIGRQYNLDYTTLNDVGDPFHGGLASQSAPRGVHADDSVGYEGRYAGISTGAKWRKGDVDGSPSGRAWGMTVGVNLGPLNIRAAHQNRNVAKVTRVNEIDITMAARNSIVAANMRFDWGTAYTAYSANRGWGNSPLFNPDNPYGASVAATRSTDSRDVLMGVAVPISRQTTLLASYVRRNDRDPANNDARQLAVGATYAVSRRLDFYAAYSRIQHLAGTRMVEPGSGSSMNVGMRRAF